MRRVIVTVKRYREARVRDLEVPAGIRAEQLARIIAQALRWERDPAGQRIEYEIEAQPPGRTLLPPESLAEAGAWDGAWLIFHPRGESAPPPRLSPSPPPPPKPTPQPPSAPTGGPVVKWRPLGIDLPHSEEEPEQGEGSKASGFVWKRLD